MAHAALPRRIGQGCTPEQPVDERVGPIQTGESEVVRRLGERAAERVETRRYRGRRRVRLHLHQDEELCCPGMRLGEIVAALPRVPDGLAEDLVGLGKLAELDQREG